MALTNTTCKNIKPLDKVKKYYDERGLILEVMPNGSKYWRLKYRILGKEKKLAFGVYPEVSLKEARDKRDEARELLRLGIDPAQKKKEVKKLKQHNAENSLESVARAWYDDQKKAWSERYANSVIRRLEADLFSNLGSKPINDIEPLDLLAVLKKVEKRGAPDMARRLLQTTGQIYRYAVIHGKTKFDITSGLVDGLSKPEKVRHFASLSEKELPEFLERLKEYDGESLTRLALELLILTFVRTNELLGARWDEIDLDKKEWRIPASRMKMKEIHIVPLSSQSIKLIRQIALFSGEREFLFPSQTNSKKSMSNNTMLFAIYRLGYHSRATSHGFRSTASTILNENNFRPDIIERQLAHVERNKVRASYNHAQYLKERTEMMQWYGNYLDSLKT
ncbi:MAG: tyrosine-type recombinase/integrase [Rickettsiales bacterium]|jgi:integrase|nr:tyrosine-type recombinase/integrase [Rickettsiales bacterium]